ncbi:OmpH family outer membrane protein [Hymenobacter sp. M29]|uniref:OmpH family outer membrane protein n=1 Tax=Hymenobacter mellowenesis TaxID=3063995 RepID=A0ABT9AEW3_9BACT|nr:OmpH family outer membrane protein [Hymenobacter sp. M29]MDO7848380.1 OmpH family outer membrane protein [Hymenobacter sp. M29]
MKIFRLTLAAALLTAGTLAATSAQAQAPLKIGYTDVQYVLAQMPESKQIESDLKAYNSQLENQLKSKTSELETKYKAYQAGEATMTDIVKADKQKELQGMQQSIQEFQQSAQQSLQQKQQTLLKPALDKLQKNIDLVADENGFTYVFNSDGGGSPLLLHAPKDGDISDMVLKKMGITPGANTPVVRQPTPAPNTTPAPKTPTKTKVKTK